MRRAIGRRYDSLNEKVYHVNDQPPLTTNAPLCERLVPVEDDGNPEATLVDRWIAFDQNKKSLQSWLVQFGDEDNKRTVLQEVDGN